MAILMNTEGLDMPTYLQEIELERRERGLILGRHVGDDTRWSRTGDCARRAIKGHNGSVFEISCKTDESISAFILGLFIPALRKPLWRLMLHPNNFPNDTRIEVGESRSVAKLMAKADNLEPKMAEKERKYQARVAELDRLENK